MCVALSPCFEYWDRLSYCLVRFSSVQGLNHDFITFQLYFLSNKSTVKLDSQGIDNLWDGNESPGVCFAQGESVFLGTGTP